MPVSILVVSGTDLHRYRRDATASLGLAWGLDRRGIAWTRVKPPGGQPDLDGVDAVLSWWGKPHARRWRFEPPPNPFYGARNPPSRTAFERALEARCAALGIPVVNPLTRRLGVRHSHCLAAWTRHGVPCARFQRFSRLEDVALPYPLVLRADGGAHAMDDAFLVRGPEEGRAVLARRAASGRPPLTLALEFMEVRSRDGLYRKRRAFYVGGRLLPRQQILAPGWQVKLMAGLAGARAVDEDRAFRARGEEEPELVARAAALLGPEVLALDYTRRDDGSYVFWEGNPIFGMAGLGDDERSLHYRAATGRSREECEEEHLALGLAIADLVLERVEARRVAAG